MTPLDEIEEEQKIAIIEELVAPPIHDKRRKQTKLANYTKKLRNAISKEHANGNSTAVSILNELLKVSPISYIDSPKILNELADKLPSRTKQRMKMVETFINAHNALITDERCGSKTRYQEIIFKIPEKWQVKSDEFTAEDNFRLVNNFLSRFLPSHPILFATTHRDENLDKEHCSHIHVFIDGKNNQSGKFDLREAELNSLDRYVNENNLDADDWNKKKKTKGYVYSQERGRVWQKIFLRAANAYFERKCIPLQAERALKTQEYEKQLLEMRRQSKKPKADRTHNYHTLIEERSALRLKELDALEQKLDEKREQLELLENVQNSVLQAKGELRELDNTLLTQKSLITTSAHAIQQQNEIIKNHKDKLSTLQQSLSVLTIEKQQVENYIAKELPLLKQVQEEKEMLKEAEKTRPLDPSMKPVILLFKMLSEYFSTFRDKKKNDESLSLRIVDAFKALASKFQRKLVLDKAMDLSREAGDKTLTKELYLIDKNSPTKDYDLQK